MTKTNLKSLIGKLNHTCRNALEGAAGLCLSQTHYEVDIEHFLIKLLDVEQTDFHKILRHFSINETHLAKDLDQAVERFKTGNSRTPALSPRIVRMVQEAWLIASLDYQSGLVRSGHILLALLGDEDFSLILKAGSRIFNQISLDALRENFKGLTAGSIEEVDSAPADRSMAEGAAASIPTGSKAMDLYTVNLTEKAKKGEIDPVLGRDFEIRQMIDILIRRRQNNPILTGEAGVGKTAVAEGFALRIVEGDVPPPLQNVEIRSLDLGLLQAGAGIKGEFENRLKSVINEVKSSPIPVILFIDEAHQLIGSGGSAGSGDAANLLKPALARGELRTIAATTWADYKKYFEKDAALARRFQVVKIEEPDEPRALVMMRALSPFLEKHHQVTITDEALLDAVRLSNRYISGRHLPDKSVSVLDTACARVAIGLTTSPPALEETIRQIAQIDRELKILEQESLIGKDHTDRIQALNHEKENLLARQADLKVQWDNEMELARQIQETRQIIRESHTQDPPDRTLVENQEKLKKLQKKMLKAQGDQPLVHIEVGPETISEVISAWTGIPTGRMLVNEIDTVLKIKDILAERIIGQDHALEAISQMVQTSFAGIEDPGKPTAVFLFVGPSGVGKTETALALSEVLYGGEENLISINMSEYQEAHTVSGLKGSPPGYVGYGEGGVLTEAVRKRPYSVVLLDEIEKAHKDVTDLFYQVFDKGVLEDGEGRRINFKNTLIILTSNLGTDMIMKTCADEETKPDYLSLAQMLHPELVKHFKPAFLGRLKVVPFFPISDKVMRLIVKLKLSRIAKRMLANRKVVFAYDDELIDAVAARCTEVDTGARNIDHILTNSLLPQMSKELLVRMAEGKQVTSIKASLDEKGFKFEIKE